MSNFTKAHRVFSVWVVLVMVLNLVSAPLANVAYASEAPLESDEVLINESAPEPMVEEVVVEEATEPAVEESVAEEVVQEEVISDEPVVDQELIDEVLTAEPVVEEVVVEEVPAEQVVSEVESTEQVVSEVEPVVEENTTTGSGGSVSTSSEPVLTPELTTDKADYAPTEKVTIFGKFFKSVYNVVLKIFGQAEDEIDNVEHTDVITTDDNGEFTYQYQLDGTYRPNYTVQALDALTGSLLAETSFTDAPPAANLDQLRNGSAASPTEPPQWANGNLGSQTAHYVEGYSVAYRTVMTNLPTSTSITLTLGYDIKHSGRHALDYLTHFNRIGGPPPSDPDHNTVFGHSAETVTPLAGISGVSGTTTTYEVPVPDTTNAPEPGQPATSWVNLSAGEKLMTLFGGTITGIAYNTQGDLAASQSETTIDVTFTVDSSTAVLAWGGHIGSRVDWGFDGIGVPRSAGGISGSPYHMRLKGWTLNNLGNQDRSLSAVAVYAPPQEGNIVVIKQTLPDGDPQSFTFNPSWGNSFNLTDGLSNDSGPLVAGNYSVSETVPVGWDLTSTVCVSSIGDTETVGSLELDPEETITCTFTNTKRGHIIVDKVTVPAADGQSFSFTTTGAGYNGFSLTDAAAANNQEVVPGTYTVSETAVAGWDLTSATCDQDETVDSIDVGPGETVNCVFTNTKRGHIVIEKQTLPNGDSADFSFTGDVAGTLSDGEQTSQEVVPGTYNSTESALAGWDLTSIVCSDGDSSGDIGTGVATFNVEPGETVTCVFTNTKDGTVVIVKNTVGDNGTFDFSGSFGAFQITTVGNTANQTFNNVDPGVYSVSESVPASWILNSATCDDSSPVNAIDVSPGETVTCTFTNTAQGKIVIVKNTVGADETFDFTVTGPTGSAQQITTNGNTGTTSNITVTAGNYSVSESTPPAGWVLTNSVCDFGAPAGFTVGAGDTVTCTFTNNQPGAKIVLSPLTAYNAAGADHVVTATVSVHNGNGTYGPAVDGTLVTFSLVDNFAGASFVGGNTCLTSGGSCSITINTTSTGSVDIHAVSSPLILGINVDVASDGTGDNTADAVKTYVNARILIGSDETNEVDDQHVFTVTVEEDTGSGFVGVAGLNPVVSFNPVPGTVSNDTCAGAGTNGSGQCTVTINSSSAGNFEASASVLVNVSSVIFNISTDGTGANSDPAYKTYVDASIALDPLEDVNAINDPHTITATVTKNDGSGVTPAVGVTVVFTVTSGTATFVGADNDCVTNGSGECSVQIEDSGTGNNTINATTTFLVGGVSLTRATNGDSGPDGTGAAAKQYVNARISITPANATNQVDEAHDFVVTVEQDTGSGWDPVESAIVDVDVSPAPDSLDETDCTNGTNASGQCTAIINSSSAGVFTATASTTINVNGVDFVLSTDGQGDNSGSATKTYVDAKISVDPQNATNNVNEPHTVTATVMEDDGLGYDPAVGETVTFTLVNNTAGASFVGGIDTCVTDLAGQCSVDINTSTPGSVEIHASVDASVSTEVVHRETDGSHGSSQNGNKDYLAGRIIVQKVTVGGDGDFDFATDYNAGFTLSNGESDNSGYIAPGTYSVSETVPAGWDLTSATCDDQSDPASIELSNGETVTCTFTNTKRGHVIIQKNAVPDDNDQAFTFNNNFGNGNPAAFDLTDTVGGGLPSYDAEVLPGVYAVSEDAVDHWHQVSATCDDGSQVGAIDVAPGETVTCTFTNEKYATITLVKNTLGGDGGFDFTMTGNGLPANDTLTTVGNTDQETYIDLDQANTYTITETVPTGWELISATCTGTNTPDDITPNAGEEITCTFTNGKLPTLTLEKTVINDNGGQAVEADFQGFISGSPVAWDDTQTLAVDNYTATEDGVAGYTASDWGTDCAADGSVSLAYGDNKTCTITNDDDAPSLTLIKYVENNYGGPAVETDWTLYANGPTPISGAGGATSAATFSAGTYDLSESVGPSGYSASDWTCTGGNQNGAQITLALGESATCEITNSDIQPKLTVTKVVINNDGGNAVISDFPLFVDATGVTSGVTNGFDAGSYTVSETQLTGYTLVGITGDCALDGSVTLAVGEEKACTITNDDIAPKLTLIKEVINDNGGTAGENDFGLTVGGNATNSSVTHTLLANTPYALDEAGLYGYSFVSLTGDAKCPQVLGGDATLDEGDDITCTITNDDVAPTLTLLKTVVNNDGGTATAGDFQAYIGATEVDWGVANEVNAGNYVASEDELSTYEASAWGGDCAADGSVSLAVGDNKICAITNDDIAPTLKLVKYVTNDNGGTLNPEDWQLYANGDARSFSDAGDSVTFHTVTAAVGYTLSEDNLFGYSASGWTCDGGNLVGDEVTLGLAEDVTCEITNDDIAPTLTLVKTVVNDNGGQAVAGDFQAYVDVTPVNWGAATVLNAGSYTASEDELPTYEASSWSGDCAADGSVTLAVGENKTCTITNNDIPPTLTIVKDSDPNDTQDFNFSGSLGNFVLDNDEGVQDGGDSATPDRETFNGLNANQDYVVTEGPQPNAYWSFVGATCVYTGTQTPYLFNLVDQSLTVNLELAVDVTCTFTNHKESPTRTQGFWKTHTAYTSSIFNSVPGGFQLGSGTSQEPIDTTAKLFGAWYSNVSKTSTGKGKNAQRSAVDHARILLSHQWLAAKLNCVAFGCSSDIQTLLANASAAYAAGNTSAMNTYMGQLDTFNNSSDSIVIDGNPGKATPKDSAALANVPFWDQP